MRKVTDVFFSSFSNVILLLIACSYLSAERLEYLPLVFGLDVYLVAYILFSLVFSNMVGRRVKFFSFTINVLVILNIVFLPAFVLVLFARDPSGSLPFLMQYYFIFTALPLFINFLIINGHMKRFFEFVFLGLLLVSLFYLYQFFFTDGIWSDYVAVGESDTRRFGGRFFLGEFTPNEMGHYFAFSLLLMVYLSRTGSRASRLFVMYPASLFAFAMTFSKTVWIQLALALLWVRKKNKHIILSLVFLGTAVVFAFHQDLFVRFVDDFSTSARSNQIRIDMVMESIGNIPNSILAPAYHNAQNLVDPSSQVTSAHNGFLSIISNFGLLSFLLLISSFILFIVYNLGRSNLLILAIIFIDLAVLMFNPLISARHVWMPLFFLLFFYYYYRHAHCAVLFDCCSSRDGC